MHFDPFLSGGRRLAFGITFGLGALLATTAYADTVLSVVQAEAPRSMDPGDHTASATGTVLEPMFEGLVKRDESANIVPVLATEWSTDATGTLWTFKLRPGVTFHDGTPFNADAVVYSIQRFLDPARGLAAAGRIKVVIDSIRAVDDLTVEFKLKSPYAGFLELMTTGTPKMVSPTADAAGTLATTPVGTGPFKFTEYKSGEYVLETRNENYWGPPPNVDQLRFTWSGEPSVLAMSVQSGDADVVYPLQPALVPAVQSNPELKLIDSTGSFIYWLSINTQMKPLDDVRVRQALNFATDRQALVAALLRGFGDPANSPLAPSNPFYDAELATYTYDPEKAKALLADAGLPNGFTMTTAVSQRDAPIAAALQGMWSKVGVNLEIRNLESGVWSQVAFADPSGKAADNLGSTIASWSTGAYNPDLQLRPLYATASWSPGGANLGFFSDPHLDELIDQGASELDEAKAKPIYVEAQKLINEQAPHVLLYSKHNLAATSAKVSGVWVAPGGAVNVAWATKSE
ncbi:Oligopeptide ABC transporter, periplasmic oligopep tide-binding protein OppA [Devosia sp. DBB001]|nr:Oligopeptide ABC transporter, periplasmic oligopep tide-binding protein OppA [Devosia sp. DBB001]